jgi:uncharacterized protein (DUF3820 family)
MDWTEIDREDFRRLLVEIDAARMPFGKYAGVAITDLPSEYLTWFAERGFPAGRLGELLAYVYEIKGVGMDAVFEPLRKARGGRMTARKPRRRGYDFE